MCPASSSILDRTSFYPIVRTRASGEVTYAAHTGASGEITYAAHTGASGEVTYAAHTGALSKVSEDRSSNRFKGPSTGSKGIAKIP